MLHGIVSETRGTCFPWVDHDKHEGNQVSKKAPSSSAFSSSSSAPCLSTPLSPPNSEKDNDPAHNPFKKRKMFIQHYARMAHQLHPHETPHQKLSDYNGHPPRRKFKRSNCQFRPGIFSLKVESLVRPRSSDAVASSTPTQPAAKAMADPPSTGPVVTIQSAHDIMDLSSDDGLSLSDLSSCDSLDDFDDDDNNKNDNNDEDEDDEEVDEDDDDDDSASARFMQSCQFLHKRRTKRMREHREQLPPTVEIDHAHLFENIDLEVPDEQFYPAEWLPSTEKMEDASIELDLSWNKGAPPHFCSEYTRWRRLTPKKKKNRTHTNTYTDTPSTSYPYPYFAC